MKWRNITAKELRGLVRKLSLFPSKSKRRAPEPIYWYYLDGKRTLRIKLPNIHGGSGSVSTGFLKQVQRSLKLTTRQFEYLVECPLTADDYEKLVREVLGKSF